LIFTFHHLGELNKKTIYEKRNDLLVVNPLDEEKKLILLYANLVIRLGLIIIGGLEDGNVDFWVFRSHRRSNGCERNKYLPLGMSQGITLCNDRDSFLILSFLSGLFILSSSLS